MTRRQIVALLIVIIPVIYTGLWLFIDIPPRTTPNIDFYKTKTLQQFSDEELTNMWAAHENSSFIGKRCFWKYLNARDKELLSYCLENGLEKNTGGGCYHLVGSYNSDDTFNALQYCGVDWKAE
ncbi:hypothetical protein ACFL48_00090 [Pseudomonadota bacterium]